MKSKQTDLVSLRSVINPLLFSYSRIHPVRGKQIINAVPAELLVQKDDNWLAPIIGDLFAILSASGDHQLLYISAREQGHAVKLFCRKAPKGKRIVPLIEKSLLPTFQILPLRFRFGKHA